LQVNTNFPEILKKEISFGDRYLLKNSVKDKIGTAPKENLRFIIIIPCYNDPGIIESLKSIWNCARPDSSVEVIVVVNSPENAEAEILAINNKTIREVKEWGKTHNDTNFNFFILNELGLPEREAGPGLARKIGMDQAVMRFNQLNHPGGIIISFDADTTCSSSYLSEIEKCFNLYPDTKGCSVYFEHPLAGNDFPEIVYRAIAEYELHLRYYISAIRATGFPYAYHTIGSCFCVTAETYVEQGGMNKRKAGEDFYFLQKVIPLGNFREINTACVYPSPRPSDRVPFGTGALVRRFIEGKISHVDTYHPGSFEQLNEILQDPSEWFGMSPAQIQSKFKRLPDLIKDFAGPDYISKIEEINNNSSTPGAFTKRFYHWFNMFRILKFLNFAHKSYYLKVSVREAAVRFLEKAGHGSFEKMSTVELLQHFRKLQKEEGRS